MKRIASPRPPRPGRSSIKAKRTPWSNTSNMPCPHFAALSRIVRAYMLAPNQKFRRTWWGNWRSCVIMLASSFELSPAPMNRYERRPISAGEAEIEYLNGEFRVLRPGAFVLCAVTGTEIKLEDLRYWNVDLQEPYASPQAKLQRLGIKP